jgi:uncharacterized membrane protein
MIKIETSVAINRPPEDVFAYISNFENNPEWQLGMQEVRFTSEAPLRVGSTHAQVAKFLGRRIQSTFEVLAYEPGRMVKASSTSGSFPITFTRMAEPLLAPMVQRSVNADYANLKHILETQAE